jgi:hypothetical protein
MAFADPVVVMYNAVSTSLYRVVTGTYTSTYQSADGSLELKPAYALNGKRRRRSIKLSHSKTIASPIQSTINVDVGMSATLVIDTPTIGYTVAEAKLVVDCLLAELTESSGALVTKILQNEN